MKKTLLSLLAITCITWAGNSQSFSDDFEMYEVGDYLAASNSEWTTWGGSTGTAEDVQITDEQAASGTKSIKLEAVGSGGPQDLVKYFGGAKITTGVLNTSMSMLVETGAYFNYQAETTIGTTWAMNAFFEADGKGRVTDSANETFLSFEYPMGEWFDFQMTINFDANNWNLVVNGNCVGSFQNDNNSIASIDLYPVSGNRFFLDDFTYDYSTEAPEITEDTQSKIVLSEENGLSGLPISIAGEFQNNGETTVTSFELEANLNGDVTPITMNGLELKKGESTTFSIADEFLIPDGASEVSLKTISVNDGTLVDEDACNDVSKGFITGFKAADHKAVIVEEATGTWCGWCPRGAVALERFSAKYPGKFIGIAVHNGDPMVVAAYDNGLGATGFPNAVVNRGTFVDPGQVEAPFISLIQQPSFAIVEQGAAWDPDTRKLDISMKVTGLFNLNQNYKVNVALTEDGVTGTGSGYAQANYYSGSQDLIDIHGVNWRDLPATIPASDMVHDHVARAILAPYEGLENSFEGGLAKDETKLLNFSYTVPADFNVDKMHIISMLLSPNGAVNTGVSNSIAEAVENGFEAVTDVHDINLSNATSVYPNPLANTTNIAINLIETSDVQITLVDMSGQIAMTKMYPNQNGYFNIQMDASALPTGMYVLKINAGDKYTTERISIVR